MLRFVGVFFRITYLKCTSTLCCYTFQVEHLVFHSEEISVSVLILLSTFKILKQNEKRKFSFPFGVLLSCSNVRISPQNENAMGMRKKKRGGGRGKNQSSVPNQSPYPHSPGCPLFTQVSLSSPMAQKARPSPLTLTYRSTLSAVRPPSTHGACHSDGPGLTDVVNIHFHWAV